MKRTIINRTLLAVFTGFLAASGGFASTLPPLEEQVRHKLVMLPRYGVFDDLKFKIDGDKVTLSGQVAQPILKADAAAALKKIEGVSEVVNNIEVLPLSPYDDQLRFAVYRAVFQDPNFTSRYGFSALPSIRILVKNGNVQLTGAVSSEFDRTMAVMRARGVFGSFNLENNLQVVKN